MAILHAANHPLAVQNLKALDIPFDEEEVEALVTKAQANDTEEGPLETYNTDAEAQKAARKELQVRGDAWCC